MIDLSCPGEDIFFSNWRIQDQYSSISTVEKKYNGPDDTK